MSPDNPITSIAKLRTQSRLLRPPAGLGPNTVSVKIINMLGEESEMLRSVPLGYLNKHLVSILLVFGKDGQQHAAAMTACVLSTQDQWFLITAGHCLEDVEKMIDSGWDLHRSCLLDSFHKNLQTIPAVPFEYRKADPTRSDQLDVGFDYGILTLSEYYRRLLEANGIQALSEEAWRHPPDSADYYWLLGIPREWTKIDYDSASINLQPLLFNVERESELPQGFSTTQVPRFYGRVYLDDELTSIEGVSGGPIFAFRQLPDGQMKYWLVAIQSSWGRESRTIVACYAHFLGEALTQYLQAKE